MWLVVVGLGVLALLFAAGVAWTVYRFQVGALDAVALAEKVAVSQPRSVLDWPEARLVAAIPQPDDRDYAIVSVLWPARPWMKASLLVALDGTPEHAMAVLSTWCAQGTPVVLRSPADGLVELRRRQSLQRLNVRLIAEDRLPA
jgi:hypothetical protein